MEADSSIWQKPGHFYFALTRWCVGRGMSGEAAEFGGSKAPREAWRRLGRDKTGRIRREVPGLDVPRATKRERR